MGFEEEEFASSMNGRVLIRILKQLKPHWKWVAGFLVAVGVVSALDAFFTYLTKQVIDTAIIPGNIEALGPIALAYLVALGFLVIGVCIFIYLCGVLGHRVQYDMRRAMFDHLQELSLSYYSKTPVGWIMSRLTSDTERIADLVTWGMLDIVWATMNIVTSLVFMLLINWQLALIVFVLVPVLIRVAIWFESRILREYRETRRVNSKITGTYNENITGVRVVKALGREQRNLDEFGNLTDNYYRAAFKAAWLSALFLPVVQLISAIAIGSVIFFGGVQYEAGMLTIGGIQAFIGYITFMLWPIQDLARVFASMQHAIASAERVFSLSDAKPDVIDKPGIVDPGSIKGDIVFENVDFGYDKEKAVFSDLNLTVKAGETIALVGPTGAGKSTIVNLICRFYEPTGGRILIDGKDYTDMPMRAIQSRVGMVLQTPHLFSGNIRDNIRYGKLEATDSEVEAAAKLAGAHDFIAVLPDDYDEEVGEGGNLLSTGQKQLISLARAVLANPEVFIMDEATSSVDTLTEALIQKGMEELMRGRTSFIIAHRLSTIRRADRILVIENGGISEQGNHAELMKQRGHYYSLYTKQFRREAEKAYGLDDLVGRREKREEESIVA
ncbi:MAG: ABC transporter ATP-binding protein [Anaerolineae bacterium]|nr:ABC transporter ATP-binding protein [Anaerolineae bacterium]